MSSTKQKLRISEGRTPVQRDYCGTLWALQEQVAMNYSLRWELLQHPEVKECGSFDISSSKETNQLMTWFHYWVTLSRETSITSKLFWYLICISWQDINEPLNPEFTYLLCSIKKNNETTKTKQTNKTVLFCARRGKTFLQSQCIEEGSRSMVNANVRNICYKNLQNNKGYGMGPCFPAPVTSHLSKRKKIKINPEGRKPFTYRKLKFKIIILFHASRASVFISYFKF